MSSTHHLITPAGALAYDDAGDASPCLLFLHGTGCDSGDWDAVRTALPTAWRTVALDFRGHGASDIPRAPFTLTDLADDVRRLIDHLRLDHVILVGHSLGGMVALEVNDPRVTALVLLEGWTRLTAAAAFIEPRFYGGLTPTQVEDIARKHQETVARCNPVIWHHFWTSVETFDGLPALETATIPIQAVYGAHGRSSETIARLLVPDRANITWHWLPAGHYLPHACPADVARVCRETVAVAWPYQL